MSYTLLYISLKVHVFYDDTFFAQFGPNIASIETRIKAVFSMVRTIFSHKSSLTTIVVPEIIQIERKIGVSWKATEDNLRYIFDLGNISEFLV